VEILEKSVRPGGLIGTGKNKFGLAELAANGLLSSTLAEELFAGIGVPMARRVQAGRNRYIFRDGRPRRWPLGILEPLVCMFRVLKVVFLRKHRPEKDETVLEWGRRVGGIAFEKYLLSTGLQGIYAGDAARMSADLILGRFFVGGKPRAKKTGT